MWTVITTDVFALWLARQNGLLRQDVLAAMLLLRVRGPALARPYVDTLYGSRYCNMKDLIIQHHGHPVRAFFAFDPKRRAVLFCAGDKRGKDERRFYKHMIKTADAEFANHLKKPENI